MRWRCETWTVTWREDISWGCKLRTSILLRRVDLYVFTDVPRGIVPSFACCSIPQLDSLTLKTKAVRFFETSITVSRHGVISQEICRATALDPDISYRLRVTENNRLLDAQRKKQNSGGRCRVKSWAAWCALCTPQRTLLWFMICRWHVCEWRKCRQSFCYKALNKDTSCKA